MRLFGQQRLERIEELLLRTVLVGEELDVIYQQQVERVIAVLEFVKSLALVSLNHIGDKLFSVDVENLAAGLVCQQAVAHGMHQVGLAQTNAAIDEKRVVQMPRHGGNVHGSGTRHAVGGALYQGLESQQAVESVTRQAGIAILNDFGTFITHYRIHHRFGKSLPDNSLPRSNRQLYLHGLAIQALQQGGNAATVLGSHPVELEAVDDKHRNASEVLTNLCVERLDPGIELLFGELLRQLINAALPQALTHFVCRAVPSVYLVSGTHEFFTLCG